MKIIINDDQRGLLFKNGSFVKLLYPGDYLFSGVKSVEVCDLAKELVSDITTLDVLLNDSEIRDQTTQTEVGDCQLALHFINGKFSQVLRRGKYAFWSMSDRHEFQMVDLSSPIVSDDIPVYVFEKLPAFLYEKIEVAEYQKARLYFNRKFVKLLDAGIYYFWRTDVKVEADLVDDRHTLLEIDVKEVLTQDKVSLRVNFVCSYRITDCVKVLTDTDDYQQQIRIVAKYALRDFTGRYDMDDILQKKDQMSGYVLSRLKDKEKELYVEISDIWVNDIVITDEIHDVMNTSLACVRQIKTDADDNILNFRQ